VELNCSRYEEAVTRLTGLPPAGDPPTSTGEEVVGFGSMENFGRQLDENPRAVFREMREHLTQEGWEGWKIEFSRFLAEASGMPEFDHVRTAWENFIAEEG
jgi:hypothetical protein